MKDRKKDVELQATPLDETTASVGKPVAEQIELKNGEAETATAQEQTCGSEVQSTEQDAINEQADADVSAENAALSEKQQRRAERNEAVKEWFKELGGSIKLYFQKLVHVDPESREIRRKNKELRQRLKEERANGPKRTFKERLKSINKENTKAFLLGSGEKRGFLQNFFSYALLILFGFVYVYPMLYMLGYSLMSPSDVSNPTVNYLPTSFYWQNYKEAAQVLNFGKTLWQTTYVAVLPALAQTVSCCLVAYGLARFKFPGKKVIFGLILLTFIVPTQLTMLPQIVVYSNLKLIDTVFSFIIPAVLGQGIKSAVFILIFYQFFRGIPDSVVEAAKIDGANSFQVFLRIGIPACVPAILLSFLLSVVWYYNETVLSAIYFGGKVTTLPLELGKFKDTYEQLFGQVSSTGKSANEAIYMAGTLLSIIPLLVLYAFTQKRFTDGIDKAGITGE